MHADCEGLHGNSLFFEHHHPVNTVCTLPAQVFLVERQWAVGSRQWAVGSGQWAVEKLWQYTDYILLLLKVDTVKLQCFYYGREIF